MQWRQVAYIVFAFQYQLFLALFVNKRLEELNSGVTHIKRREKQI